MEDRKKKKSKCHLERYARITGYFRSTASWNPGKIEELKNRKHYKLTKEKTDG